MKKKKLKFITTVILTTAISTALVSIINYASSDIQQYAKRQFLRREK